MRRLMLPLSAVMLIFLAGCSPGSGDAASTGPVTVSTTPSTTQQIDQGQTVTLTGYAMNDAANGISWTVSGGGTLASATGSANTYTAPATVATPITATVTATSTKDSTKSASISIVVSTAPTISSATVPTTGTVGTAYSGSIAATGGTGDKTFAVSSGTFIPGVTLSQMGTLSGTPTAAGSYTFTITASDSSFRSLTASRTFTVVVTLPPLAITTASIATPVRNVTYSQAIGASGGVPGYTYSVSAGALPSGLSLNATTGVISGTPTSAAAYNFTIRVTDAVPNSVSQTYTGTVSTTLPIGVNNGSLSMTYVFYFKGFRNGSASGVSYASNMIGLLIFDGKGTVTGNMQFLGGGTVGSTSVSGSYTVDADNRGKILLGGVGTTYVFSIGIVPAQTGFSSTQIDLIRFDNPGITDANGVNGSGIARPQYNSSVTGSIKGRYIFALQGVSPCSTCATLNGQFGTLSAVGGLTFDGAGNVTSGQWDESSKTAIAANTSVSGLYDFPGGTSRGYVDLYTAIPGPVGPTYFYAYAVSASELMVMSGNSGSSYVGEAFRQNTNISSFSNSNLTSSGMVGYETMAIGGDGATVFPNKALAALSTVIGDGAGNLTIATDSNNAGTVTLNGTATPYTYSVASNGRVTLASGGTAAGPIMWLIDTNRAVGIDRAGPGLLLFDRRVGAATSDLVLALGSSPPVNNGNTTAGVFTITAAGAASYIQDVSGADATLSSGQSVTTTYATTSNTRFALPATGTPKLLMYPSVGFFCVLDLDPNNTNPTVTILTY